MCGYKKSPRKVCNRPISVILCLPLLRLITLFEYYFVISPQQTSCRFLSSAYLAPTWRRSPIIQSSDTFGVTSSEIGVTAENAGVTSLTLIWPHLLRSPPPAAGHESFYSKSIQFFNCASNRIEKQYVLSCRYLHVLTLEGLDSTELMWNMSKHAKCYFGLCKKGPHLCRP